MHCKKQLISAMKWFELARDNAGIEAGNFGFENFAQRILISHENTLNYRQLILVLKRLRGLFKLVR